MATVQMDQLSEDDAELYRIGLIALNDIYTGPCNAILEAKDSWHPEAMDVVNYVYSHDTLRPRYTPTECPECGRLYLGVDAAHECCREVDEFEF
jgi:hypothetical protein